MQDIIWLVMIGTAAGSAALGGARKLLERRSARRELARHPPLGTQTPDGTVVRVTGVVRVRDTLIVAPLSGVECVAARARVTSGNWQTRRALKPREWFAIVSFVLERAAEPPILVEGVHAKLDLAPERLERAKRGSPELARREQLMLQLGDRQALATRADFEEVVVRPGMRVSIAGLMMLALPDAPPASGNELGFRDQAPSTLRLVGNATHPLVIGAPIA